MITGLTLLQKHTIGANNLMALHSPLIFIASVTYGGDAPESINVEVRDSENFLLETFNATPFRDESLTERLYIFNASSVLRKFMPKFDEINQSTLNAITLTNHNRRFLLTFVDSGETFSASVFILAANAAKQYGDTELLTAIYDNSPQNLYAFKGREYYCHFFYEDLMSPTNEIQIQEAIITSPVRGVYRYKGLAATTGDIVVSMDAYDPDPLKIFPIVEQTIKVLPNCEDGLFVKFIDSMGFYRHWLFNKFYTTDDSHENIGNVIKARQNLLEPTEQSVGRRSQRQTTAIADGLNYDMLNYLNPIYTSPRIYIKSGNLWLETRISNGSYPVKWAKRNGGSLSVTFDADERFNLTML